MTQTNQQEDDSLQDRVAVITGGAGGLGQEIAMALVRRGASIVSLDLKDSEATVERVSAAGGKAISFSADLTDEMQVASVFQNIMKQCDRIDILVNTAGFYQVERRPFWGIDLAEWRRVMTTNVDSTFLCAQYASAPMRKQKYGRIINISSNTITFGMANLMHYIAAKAAIIGMTRSMARELGEFEITVNAVAPGLVSTPAAIESLSEEVIHFAIQSQAIHTQIEPDDIASAVTYLCSPGTRLVTGQTLLVNGGATCSGI